MSFSWDDYEEDPRFSNQTVAEPQGFDWDAAEEENNIPEFKSSEDLKRTSAEKDLVYQQYKVPEYSEEQLKNMSASERYQYSQDLKREREYLQSAGFTKGLLKGTTFGISEKVPGLKAQEHEPLSGLGQFIGELAPYGVIYKAISYPVNILKNLTNFGKVGRTALEVGKAAITGSTGETAKQAIKGEGFNIGNIALAGAEFGALDSLFRGAKGAYNWIKNLKPAQQAEILAKGIIPNDLTPNQYKFYENEIVPQLQKTAQSEYENALQKAVQENDQNYQKQLANTRATHEQDLLQRQQKNQLSEEKFAKAQEEYQNKIKQIAVEHEAKVAEIERENQAAQKEFEQQRKDFETMKSRQQAVLSAIQPKEVGESLSGRVRQGGEDIGFRPAPSAEINPTLKNRVGNVISPVEPFNTTEAGRANIEAVRANDRIDHGLVDEAYNLSDQLNSEIAEPQFYLINQLEHTARELSSVPKLSPPQEQLLNGIEKILDKARPSSGTAQPINNRVLQEQAKAFRYFMDYKFEFGNTRGIFTPTVNQLEQAVEISAWAAGKPEAAEASRNARSMYREWAQMYDNAYIRPYRDVNNFDYSKTFKSSLDFDEFNVLNQILSRSNAGQQLANGTRRALVQKNLSKFFDNPRKINPSEFDESLRELRAVISSEEEQAIRTQFNEARRTPVIIAKKVNLPEVPEVPKLKELPRAKIPIFTETKKEILPITEVRIPLKNKFKETPQLKNIAQRMKITPEQAMKKTETPSGIKELSSELNKTESGKQLYEKLKGYIAKDIVYEGNINRKFTGGELKNIFNKGNNYARISELFGEEVAADLLQASEKIADKRATVDAIKKYSKKVGTIKAALIFGII